MAILDIPWEASRYLLSKYKGILTTYKNGLYLYKGTSLPIELKEYETQDFSYARWLEDDFQLAQGRPRIKVATPSKVFAPHEHQKKTAKEIFNSFARGWSGFLLASTTGVGKTLAGLLSVILIAQKAGFTADNPAKLLVVCPKAAIPQWRQTMVNFPATTRCLRPLIINYQQLAKLLESKTAANAKTKRGKNRAIARTGTPTVDWDYVIFDESHYLKNYPTSTMSINAVKIAKLDKPYTRGKTPFVVFSTATPGATPLNMALMSGFLSRLIDPKLTHFVTPDKWGEFLMNRKFAVTKTKTGYAWATVPWFGKNSSDPAERKKFEMATKKAKLAQRQDTLRIGKALKTANAPFIRITPKEIEGWPEQQPIPLPLELTHEQRKLYEQAWSVFKKFLKLPGPAKDSKSRLVEDLRYRQKVSLLKVGPVSEYIRDKVDEGFQIYVNVEFSDSVKEFERVLTGMKIPWAEYSGDNVSVRDGERIRFQKGEAKVIICTVCEAVSFHAGETLPDGTQATSAERISIIHTPRNNPENHEQSLGRAHRDGQNSVAVFPYIENTIDEKLIDSVINKSTNMANMTGATNGEPTPMERAFAGFGNRY